MRPQICGKYVTFYPTKLNPMTFFKGRCLTGFDNVFQWARTEYLPTNPSLVRCQNKTVAEGEQNLFVCDKYLRFVAVRLETEIPVLQCTIYTNE